MQSIIAALLVILVTATPALIPIVVATPTGQGFLSTRGTSIVDSAGQVVQLRGVNYPGYEDDFPTEHSQSAYLYLASLGFNVVRLPISWANMEPQPGVFNTEFLTWRIDQDVLWASIAGVRIIFDMHQYFWAERFGGLGAPDWSVQQYPANQLGLREAVTNFWTDTKLQDHLISVWVKIAQHYANQPSIAGYDILNEPWIYTSIDPGLNGTAVDSFYARAVQAIRGVDKNHIIFLEPANLDAFKLPTATNIVWSPHFYQLAFVNKYYEENYTLLQADFQAEYQKLMLDPGVPMWIGEFGSFIPDHASSIKWTQDVVSLFNKNNIGWAWWAYTGTNQVPSSLSLASN
jgi:endoglycosylceramidase